MACPTNHTNMINYTNNGYIHEQINDFIDKIAFLNNEQLKVYKLVLKKVRDEGIFNFFHSEHNKGLLTSANYRQLPTHFQFLIDKMAGIECYKVPEEVSKRLFGELLRHAKVIHREKLNYAHLDEAIQAVDAQVAKAEKDASRAVKAAAGVVIARSSPENGVEILLGRLNKLDRLNPKDLAGVHGSYGTFSGTVEMEDLGKGYPTVVETAAREVKEESLGVLSKKEVRQLLADSQTQLLKNAGWANFPAALFLVHISPECGEEWVKEFSKRVSRTPQHEITALAWIPLKRIQERQAKKQQIYDEAKEEILAKESLTKDELIKHPELQKIYNTNVVVAEGISVAHMVARTLSVMKT